MKRHAVEQWDKFHPSAMHGVGSGYLSKAFGSVAAVRPVLCYPDSAGLIRHIKPGQTRPNQPISYLEKRRAEAQQVYQEEKKYWADHADEFQK